MGGDGARLVEPPATVGELVGGVQLRLVAGHAVEDVEQRVLLELGKVARLQPRRAVQVALRYLRGRKRKYQSTHCKPRSNAGREHSLQNLVSMSCGSPRYFRLIDEELHDSIRASRNHRLKPWTWRLAKTTRPSIPYAMARLEVGLRVQRPVGPR